MKASELKKIIREEILKEMSLVHEDDTQHSSDKSINDEFQVNDWMLKDIEKTLEKVNKKLKARNLPILELNVLDSEWIVKKSTKAPEFQTDDEDSPFVRKKLVHTIKIEGDIPEIKDYEFIAKIEHGTGGNIINMVPNSSVEKLPDEYKTHSQKCDICHTNRERNNTFIIKKVDTGELICAGSSCLKKFMPLDAVKGMMTYAIQLNDLRDVLWNYEAMYQDEGRTGGFEGGGGNRIPVVHEPLSILSYCLVAYLSDGGEYISKSRAYESDKQSTVSKALNMMWILENPAKLAYEREQKQKMQKLFDKYKNKAKDMAKNILEWAKTFDFDKAAQDNPRMDAYFHNVKTLLNRKYLESKHLGYFSSIISLYLREMNIKSKPKIETGAEYYGEIGQKIIDMPVEVQFVTSFDTQYGRMFVYTMFDAEGHLFVYKGKMLAISDEALSLAKGDKILLSGTIKKHQEYRGKKQTIIQRPKIKEAS